MRIVKNEEIGSLIELLRKSYDIELKGWEIRKLAYYVSCFNEKGEEDAKIGNEKYPSFVPFLEAWHYFMIDHFGLDEVILGKLNNQTHFINGKKFAFKKAGMDLLGTEPFKEYRKRNVDIWRQERKYI